MLINTYIIKEDIMTVNQAVYKRLEEILKQKLMSFYRLQRKSGVTPATFQSLRGPNRKGVNLKTVLILINALEITPEEFFASPLFKEENLVLD